MSGEKTINQEGYIPEIIPNGYQPERNNAEEKPQYGYQPTGAGESPTNHPSPPKEE